MGGGGVVGYPRVSHPPPPPPPVHTLATAKEYSLAALLQSNLSTTAKHGDKRVGLCREFDLISEFFR